MFVDGSLTLTNYPYQHHQINFVLEVVKNWKQDLKHNVLVTRIWSSASVRNKAQFGQMATCVRRHRFGQIVYGVAAMFTHAKNQTLVRHLKAISISLLALGVATTSLPGGAMAQSGAKGKSGLPLPRFVSLKSKRINMRVGPGKDYKVDWLYLRQGLPMEVIQEFDHWRKVRDPEGQEGWIYHSLLSGKRTAIVEPWNKGKSDLSITLHEAPSGSSAVLAKLEPGVVTQINYCEYEWCEVKLTGVTGFVEQGKLWGVYPDEKVEN